MKVLVDTPLWALLFRRKVERMNQEDRTRREALKALIRDDRAILVGPIRHEVLSGISDVAVFERLRDRLRGILDERLTTDDFESAASASNTCRAAGISGSGTDFLQCAVALRLDVPVYTTDGDFRRYARHLPVRLHAVPKLV